MKRLAWSTGVILATCTAVLLVWELHAVVTLFISSLVIAAILRPLVDWFARRHFSRSLALFFTYLLCIGFILIIPMFLGGPLLANIEQLTKDLTSGYEQLLTQWPNGTSFQQTLAENLPPATDLYEAIIGPQGTTLLQTALGFTLGSFDILSQLLISFVVSIYWSADQEHFKRLWVSLLPIQRRSRAREIWQSVEFGLGGYLRSQLIQSMLALILLSLGYQALGLSYSVALALVGTIGWLIPWVGFLFAVIPAVIVGLSTSLELAVLTTVLTIGVLSFLEFVVEPHLFNRRQFSSLLVVIVMLVLADQFGLFGLLIAPPLAAVIQIVAGQVIRSPVPLPGPQVLSNLQERLQSAQTLSATEGNAPTPEITNLVERLNQLIDRATHS